MDYEPRLDEKEGTIGPAAWLAPGATATGPTRPAATEGPPGCAGVMTRAVARHELEEPPAGDYLDRLMRRASFEALWPLFAKATRPAKEMTESFSALEHLRPFMSRGQPCRVIHVGDGAHARTGAMFALKTEAENISVDPLINEALVDAWRERFAVRRFAWRKASILDVADQLNALPPMPVLVTFVHAHVAVDAVLSRLRWSAAYTLACCLPGHQLSVQHEPVASGADASVLSSGRQYQVLTSSGTVSRAQPSDAR